MKTTEGRKRVLIEAVTPSVDNGRYAVCRVIGDTVQVTAAIFADGHASLGAHLLYRRKAEKRWRTVPMKLATNDVWAGSFQVDSIGLWSFTVQAWVDHFGTWASDLKKRLAAQQKPILDGQELLARQDEAQGAGVSQEIPLAFRTGAILIEQAAARTQGKDVRRLREISGRLEKKVAEGANFYEFPLSGEEYELVLQYPDLEFATRFAPDLPLWVDRELARFSAWYELFPRSASPVPGRHGAFRDVERQLPEIAAMGFDIVYLPPIHPIGRSFRKGRNNATTAQPCDEGSPWAIGDKESAKDAGAPDNAPSNGPDNGGHKSIHPKLGAFADFASLVAAAQSHGLEIAMDIAFQCSPDHPWVSEHPDWFVIRPDGSIQYAENPPKKYQDIYPLNFESADWRALWNELYSVFEFWIKHDVHAFRVDNPHTKSLPFWEWCIGRLRENYPETILLAEAFTRPHVMYALAKLGFTQSYTYFTWRNTKQELEEYLTEIAQPPVSDFFQPNFWPNTPDILHKALQTGGRPAFMQRLILAATLAANYGIYGPAFELSENAPACPAPGKTESEEYLDSEKYQIRQRDRNAEGSLVPLITSLNRIRRSYPALQSNLSLHFHTAENPQILCYSKSTPGSAGAILIAVNLNPFSEEASWIHLDLEQLGILDGQSFQVEDQLTGTRYRWNGSWNYVALRPDVQPAHIFLIHGPESDVLQIPTEV